MKVMEHNSTSQEEMVETFFGKEGQSQTLTTKHSTTPPPFDKN
jgi:hypothetical protein